MELRSLGIALLFALTTTNVSCQLPESLTNPPHNVIVMDTAPVYKGPELPPAQQAMLYNPATIKVKYLQGEVPITFCLPQWSVYKEYAKDKLSNATFKIDVHTPYVGPDYSWYYIPSECIKDFQNSVITYTGTNLKNENIYRTQVSKCDTTLYVTEDYKAPCLMEKVYVNLSEYVEGAEDFQLPVVYYFFKLQEGNALALKVIAKDETSEHLYNTAWYYESDLGKSKELAKDKEASTRLVETINDFPTSCLNNVVFYDYVDKMEPAVQLEDEATKASSEEMIIDADSYINDYSKDNDAYFGRQQEY